jgi:hypothetical protein
MTLASNLVASRTLDKKVTGSGVRPTLANIKYPQDLLGCEQTAYQLLKSGSRFFLPEKSEGPEFWIFGKPETENISFRAPLPAWINVPCASGHLTRTHRLVLWLPDCWRNIAISPTIRL